MVQLEELEGKFSEFPEFIDKITEKREEVYTAFETKKLELLETRNRRAASLQNAAYRILKGISNRLNEFESLQEINGYMASDLMVDKVRDMVKELVELGDTVKADELNNRLKSTKEEAVRQLKDRTDLYDGDNAISFGRHTFSVNNQPLDLTIVPRSDGMYYHITGTNFFEAIQDPEFTKTKAVWDQILPSENDQVYRAEYLAWMAFQQIFSEHGNLSEAHGWTPKQTANFISEIASSRYNEGYTKGVHDADATLILTRLIHMAHLGGVLKYSPEVRACAGYFWNFYVSEEVRAQLNNQLKSAGIITTTFPNTHVFDDLILHIGTLIKEFCTSSGLFSPRDADTAAHYLFEELATNDKFSISKTAFTLCEQFVRFLKSNKKEKSYKDSLQQLHNDHERFRLTKSWLMAFLENHPELHGESIDEAALVLLTTELNRKHVINVGLSDELEGLLGDHPRIENGKLELDYYEFADRLKKFTEVTVPLF